VIKWQVPILFFLCLGCQQDEPPTPDKLLRVLEDGCASKDTGMLLMHVDIHYQDDLGGPGRLEDDLRRMFTVYGKLEVELSDVLVSPEEIATMVWDNPLPLIGVSPERVRMSGNRFHLDPRRGNSRSGFNHCALGNESTSGWNTLIYHLWQCQGYHGFPPRKGRSDLTP